jgi:hypothetical protein
MRGRPRISLSLIRATFCRDPRLDVAVTLQTPNRGAERKSTHRLIWCPWPDKTDLAKSGACSVKPYLAATLNNKGYFAERQT